MRPIISDQNPWRNPLNALLGAEAHIRILRILATEDAASLTAPDLAARSGLTIRGTRKALKRLLQSGFVDCVGGGRKHQYKLRSSDMLMRALLTLFQTEKDRYEAFLGAIKFEIENLIPYAHAAWIQVIPAAYGDPMIMGILHETKCLAHYIQQLQKQLYQVERNFDITIEVNGYTKADFPGLDSGKMIPLYGVLPFPDNDRREMYATPLTHEEKNQQMLELSHRLAEAIGHDTSLVRRAKEHIQRMLKSEHGSATKDIEEWRDILESYSTRRLSQLITSTSERANRLRQSNPFFAILNHAERSRLLDGLARKP